MLCRNPYDGKHGCGQCLPCRINRRRLWASRLMFEQMAHGSSSFVTLTYDDDHVPKTEDGKLTLRKKDYQSFMKRLRKDFPDGWFRYYCVGEYGAEGERAPFNPHYHMALFGFECLGKRLRPETGERCYCERCEYLREKWGHGNITVDELNDTTSAYIAGYVIKKMTSVDDPDLDGRVPEFGHGSQGIARDLIPDLVEALKSQYGSMAFQLGDVPSSLRVGGKLMPLGRYLRRKLREHLDIYTVDEKTGEIKYGAPEETIQELEKLSSPAVQNVQARIFDAPLGSEKRKKLFLELDKARGVDASRRLQKIRNLEAKFNLYKQRKKL